MKTAYYKIASRIIRIRSIYDQVHVLCRDYRIDTSVDFTNIDLEIQTDPGDLTYERKKSLREHELENRSFPDFDDAYLETLAIYRKISEQMLSFDTFLMHGSAISVDGMAYLFTAKSGTGKSTHTRLWRQYLGDRAVMVNDDKPLIRVFKAGDPDTHAAISQEHASIVDEPGLPESGNRPWAQVCGTPWNGKHHLGSNIIVPLKAICFIEQGRHNRINKVDPLEIYPLLLQQAYRPSDRIKLAKTLHLLDLLCQSVDFYKLSCNMDPEAAVISYEAMRC